jgi:hypothetical protein
MADVNNKIEEFLRKNKGIIIKIARKSLGCHFNEKEAMSIAYLAGLQAKVYKRDQFQKTKDTTVFVWYLKKGFESIRGLDGGESVNRGRNLAKDLESKAVDFDRLFSLSNENELSSWAQNFQSEVRGTEAFEEGKREFCVCIKSFIDKEISKKILDTLRLLTHQYHSVAAINELAKMYGCKRKTALSTRILKELISEIDASGLRLFKAECMNGAYSTVIVCARSKEEAVRYFSEYGKVLRYSQLIISRNKSR